MNYSSTRYSPVDARGIVWKEIVRYLEAHFDLGNSVLDAGCGYGDFISNVNAKERYAVDLDGGMGKHLPNGVEFKQCSVAEIGKLYAQNSMSFIFSSNILEHLTREEINRFFEASRGLLKPNGLLGILMPNYRRAYKEYFDDYTHLTAISDVSLKDWMGSAGFTPLFSHPGFMPFSVKDTKMPVRPFLVRAWLRSPWKPGGKQMLVIARKSESIA